MHDQAESNYVIDELGPLLEKLKINKCLYIGSLGFEERSLAVAQLLTEKKINAKLIFITAYSGDDKSKRHEDRKSKYEKNRKLLLKLQKKPKIIPYSIVFPDSIITEVQKKLKKSDTVIFDFSTMPKIVFFPLFKMIRNASKSSIICVYTSPLEYTSDPLSYETAEPRIISGFAGKSLKYDALDVWIPILGFESNIAREIMAWGNFATVFPVIAFPGYRAHYVDRVFVSNSEILSLSQIQKIYYSSSNNPFATKQLITNIARNQKSNNIVLSPMGPKPHSLGVCLAALEHDLRVVYSQPWDYNPDYSSGCGTIYAYLVSGVAT